MPWSWNKNLGGFLTGLEILKRLREQLLRPLLVVIGELSEAEKTLAAELRIDYVCSWDDGLENIVRVLRGFAEFCPASWILDSRRGPATRRATPTTSASCRSWSCS